jgi:hypothetical protein
MPAKAGLWTLQAWAGQGGAICERQRLPGKPRAWKPLFYGHISAHGLPRIPPRETLGKPFPALGANSREA